jgi:hypothetical protein
VSTVAESEAKILLTTQPGWAFATIEELRGLGVPGRFPRYHRDSSLLVPDLEDTEPGRLITPAIVCGIVHDASSTGRDDAVSELTKGLKPKAFKEKTLTVLRGSTGAGHRRFSISTEAYGRTTMHRKQLASAIEDAVKAAFPRWRRAPEAGARFLCKADPEYAVLALQLHTNLGGDHSERPGSLREHLSAGLLTIAGAARDSAVFDPFMGTGTILKVASEAFRAGPTIGLEVSRETYEEAERRLKGTGSKIFNRRFEDFDMRSLPADASLVSNVPFGRRFPRASSEVLTELVNGSPFRGKRSTLLMSREQAMEVSKETGLRSRNVLVLGQPASIAYG